MKKTLAVANAISLILTIFVNYLSNTGALNGSTMKSVSDKYFSYFTPAGYAFSIWGLIYIGLIGFAFHTGRHAFKKNNNDPALKKIGWWFVLSCCANSLWVYSWLYDYTVWSVFIMLIILFSLGKIVVNTGMELDEHPFKSYLFIFWPFAIYFDWISVAFIANVAAMLTKVGWGGWGISEVYWAVIMICVAGLVNVIMVRMRNLREYAAVGIWALMAISVSNSNNGAPKSIAYTCYTVTAILFVAIIMNALKNRHRSFEKM